MSHDESCADFLERIVCFLDNELDASDVESVRAHLDECGPCLHSYDLQRTVKALVARSCRSARSRSATPRADPGNKEPPTE